MEYLEGGECNSKKQARHLKCSTSENKPSFLTGLASLLIL